MKGRFILLLVLVFSLVSRAQTPFNREFWLNESNVSVHVNDISYYEKGFIWLATEKGVYSFDGKNFKPVISDVKVAATAIASVKGKVYVGFKDGNIGMVENGKIVLKTLRGNIPTTTINSIKNEGSFLRLATEEGLFLIAEDLSIKIAKKQGLSDDYIYDDIVVGGKLLIANDNGINLLNKEGEDFKITKIGSKNGLPDDIVRVLEPLKDTNKVWVGTQEGGIALLHLDTKKIQTFKSCKPWVWGQVNDILTVSDDEAWVATERNFLLKINLNNDSLEVKPFSFEGISFKKLLKDKAGNIWAATNHGLMLTTGLYASKILLDNFQLKKIAATVCDENNRLWFARDNNVFVIPLSNPRQYHVAFKVPSEVTCLYINDRDHLWIGTLGGGVFYYDFSTQNLKKINNQPDLVNGHILSIAGIGNNIWIASLNGVDEMKVDFSTATLTRIKHHSKNLGLSSDYIYQLSADNAGKMWMATDGGGVCMYDGKEYHHWEAKDGLKDKVVYSITIDNIGNVWAGTTGNSIYRFNGKKWQHFSLAEMSPRDNVAALKADADGNVFIVTEKGVFQWFQNEKQFRVYNSKLGMDIDSTSTALNLIATDKNSNTYIPYEHGFLLFNKLKADIHITPDIKINTISLDYESIGKNRHTFSNDENHFIFSFGATNFSNPEKIFYRYQLEGYETKWIYTNDNEVSFSKLVPGDYTFKIQASLSNDFLHASEDNFSFSIKKPFYIQIWFMIGLAFLIFSFGYYYQTIRNARTEKITQLQKERMVFEYEHLKSQVNPHFLFNSLNTLISLIEVDKDAAVIYTEHLSDLYRKMISFRDKDLVTLAEEFEIINNYMYIQKSRFGDALKLEVDVPEEYYKTKKIVPLALQLLVENAMKHNVVSRSVPLTIFIFADDEQIAIYNFLQLKMSKEKGAGLGLINIHKRYSLLTNKKVFYGIENNKFVVTLPWL